MFDYEFNQIILFCDFVRLTPTKKRMLRNICFQVTFLDKHIFGTIVYYKPAVIVHNKIGVFREVVNGQLLW